ncbi:M15 family metallopeptidase [Parabacteroides sp. PF5-9]|uniref:M15 family metallopeptidase n=1 Tax=Parabacteroides sp. PF5-9 TaxID=1742404 RepID=UPI002473131B|nr:M15 family metallopeptidase [Parabacteroides sp. PF5-9]MDH6356814.1 D-alanyl-D-alanine dipeptidase [Parabacteroides sp. PF5-9]
MRNMNRLRYCLVVLVLLFSHQLYGQQWDRILEERGYVDVLQKDPTIHLHMMYAYPDNIFGKAVYTGLTKIWLRPEAAEKLLKAQKLLKEKFPDHSIIVYDAARPMSVQQQMWNLVKGTSKTNYVSNPANGGGLHNYGMAVDVSIVDKDGVALPMGSAIDHFGPEAHINKEEELLQSGQITSHEYDNRRFLRQIMRQAGFTTILYEWWHFNACSRAEAKRKYPVIE